MTVPTPTIVPINPHMARRYRFTEVYFVAKVDTTQETGHSWYTPTSSLKTALDLVETYKSVHGGEFVIYRALPYENLQEVEVNIDE